MTKSKLIAHCYSNVVLNRYFHLSWVIAVLMKTKLSSALVLGSLRVRIQYLCCGVNEHHVLCDQCRAPTYCFLHLPIISSAAGMQVWWRSTVEIHFLSVKSQICTGRVRKPVLFPPTAPSPPSSNVSARPSPDRLTQIFLNQVRSSPSHSWEPKKLIYPRFNKSKEVMPKLGLLELILCSTFKDVEEKSTSTLCI